MKPLNPETLLGNRPLGVTPADASDSVIEKLHELEHETTYLRSMPSEDWHIDIGDDGEMVGRCPRCGCRDISALTPEWLQCLGCGHKDGERSQKIMGVTAGVEPDDYRPAPYVDPDME